MELVEDADSDLVKDLAGAPATRDSVPGSRCRDYDVSFLHLGGLLGEVLGWVDASDL